MICACALVQKQANAKARTAFRLVIINRSLPHACRSIAFSIGKNLPLAQPTAPFRSVLFNHCFTARIIPACMNEMKPGISAVWLAETSILRITAQATAGCSRSRKA
jgi:hypothetical protein